MKAGRELDALVAEKVMGVERNADGLFYVGHAQWRESAFHEWKRGGPGYGQPRPYSTDIAAAWEVVSHLVAAHDHSAPERWYVITNNFYELEHRVSWITVIHDAGERHKYTATGETAPLAICLAALKAVGAA